MEKGDWAVERKIQWGQFLFVRGGYETEFQAKASAYRYRNATLGAYTWRIVCDNGPDAGRILETRFFPGKRAVWAVVQEARK